MEHRVIENEDPVLDTVLQCFVMRSRRVELFGNASQMGGKFHLRLDIGERPIANKYREGKMKSALDRELDSMLNSWKGKETTEVSHDF